MLRLMLIGVVSLVPFVSSLTGTAEDKVKVLFLGDRGHHRPEARFRQLQPVLAARGVELTYTQDIAELNPENLARYDALAIYANIGNLPPRDAVRVEEMINYLSYD